MQEQLEEASQGRKMERQRADDLEAEKEKATALNAKARGRGTRRFVNKKKTCCSAVYLYPGTVSFFTKNACLFWRLALSSIISIAGLLLYYQ